MYSYNRTSHLQVGQLLYQVPLRRTRPARWKVIVQLHLSVTRFHESTLVLYFNVLTLGQTGNLFEGRVLPVVAGAMHGYYGMWFSCWSLSDDFWSDTRTDCELMLDLQKLPCESLVEASQIFVALQARINLCVLYTSVVRISEAFSS